MQLDEISYEKTGGVAGITLDRPDKLNAISARPGGMRDQILWALADAEDDPEVGCVLLTGAGRGFSGGGDVSGNARRESAAEHQQFLETAEAFHRRLRNARLPIVAAVHGVCLGAALTMVASCDLVIAAASARFGLPEGRIGLVGATSVVPVVGRQWAKFLMLTGETITAARAREIGLVLTVEPDDQLLARDTIWPPAWPASRVRRCCSTSGLSTPWRRRPEKPPVASPVWPPMPSPWPTAPAPPRRTAGPFGKSSKPRG